MNKCRSCDAEIPDDQTICYDCAKKFADATEKMWKECAEELKKEYIFDLKKRITETARELQQLEEEKRKIDIPIDDIFTVTKFKPTKWINVPDFMEDVINICPTCGTEFSMPDGTSVAYYFKYCPFCGDKMED